MAKLPFEIDEIMFDLSENISADMRSTAAVILQTLVLASPVGNPSLWAPQSLPAPKGYVGGRFRGNWLVSTGAPDTSKLDTIDESGGSTLEKGNLVIQAYDSENGSYPIIYVQNNLPYANRLNEGHAVSAPIGWVEVAVQDGVDGAAQLNSVVI